MSAGSFTISPQGMKTGGISACLSPRTLILLLAFSLAACTTSAVDSGVTPAPPAATVTRTPTFSLTVTQALTPTTPTPSPTLSQEELERLLSTLLEDNDGCKLPCWWGIIPGVSDFAQARELIQSLAISFTKITENRIVTVRANISVPVQTSSEEDLLLEMRRNIEGKVESLSVFGYSFSSFPLATLLDTLGQPKEVRYQGPLWFPAETYYFELSLFYPDHGVVAQYYSTGRSPGSDNIAEICDPEQMVRSHEALGFLFWAPVPDQSFEETMGLISWGEDVIDSVPIELISNMDPADFYENFRSETHTCLEIDIRKYADYSD